MWKKLIVHNRNRQFFLSELFLFLFSIEEIKNVLNIFINKMKTVKKNSMQMKI